MSQSSNSHGLLNSMDAYAEDIANQEVSQFNSTVENDRQFSLTADSKASIIAPCGKGNWRNSEGDMMCIVPGKFLIVYNCFKATGDHDEASIYGMLMEGKEGERAFTEPFKLDIDSGKLNVMSPILLKDPDTNKLLLIVAEKNSTEDIAIVSYRIDYHPEQPTSKAISLKNKHYIIEPESGYYNTITPAHCKFIKLPDGRHRLCLPVARAHDISDYPDVSLEVITYYCDDRERKQWHTSNVLRPTNRENSFEEPDLVQLSNGLVYMNIRTAVGKLYYSVSEDHGKSWSEAKETDIENSRSSVSIGKIPGTDKLWMLLNGAKNRTKLQCAYALDPIVPNSLPQWENIHDLSLDQNNTHYQYPMCMFSESKDGPQAHILFDCYRWIYPDSKADQTIDENLDTAKKVPIFSLCHAEFPGDIFFTSHKENKKTET